MFTLLDTCKEQASACLKEAVSQRSDLLSYARNLTQGDEETAGELVQEATLRLHERVQKKGRPEGPLKPFLFTVMRNAHRDAQRRAGRHVSVDVNLSSEGEGEDLREHPLLSQVTQQQDQDTENRLHYFNLADKATDEMRARFPLHERVAFRLSAEDYSTREIGLMLGAPHRTVAHQVQRIKSHLQKFLQPFVRQAAA